MLLAREKKIVTLLIEHEDKLTTTQIATSLKVSSRTIKADIKKINEELEKHSCRINSQQGVGLWIEYDNHEAKKYLKEVTRDTADLYLSPEVRKYHLAVELLLQDDYTSMEALAKEYYISKATVLNDLNELDELWEHYGVHFIKKVKYGIKVSDTFGVVRSAQKSRWKTKSNCIEYSKPFHLSRTEGFKRNHWSNGRKISVYTH